MKRRLGATALACTVGFVGPAVAEELRGKVLRWEPDFGALHLERPTGEEVVVPVSGETEIAATYGDLADGTVFEAGERVIVSRDDAGPIRIKIEPPEPEAATEPGEKSAEPEATATPAEAPPSSPSPSPNPEPPAESAPEVTPATDQSSGEN
jgi:hypothetical protein